MEIHWVHLLVSYVNRIRVHWIKANVKLVYSCGIKLILSVYQTLHDCPKFNKFIYFDVKNTETVEVQKRQVLKFKNNML